MTWQPGETCCPSTSPFYFLNHRIENVLIANCEIGVTESWMCLTLSESHPPCFHLLNQFSVLVPLETSRSPRTPTKPRSTPVPHIRQETPLKNYFSSKVRFHSKLSSVPILWLLGNHIYFSAVWKSLLCSVLHRCRLCQNFSGTLQIWMKDLRAARALTAESKHLAKEIKCEGPAFWLDSATLWAGNDLVTRRFHLGISHFQGSGGRWGSSAAPNEGILYRQNPDIWNV